MKSLKTIKSAVTIATTIAFAVILLLANAQPARAQSSHSVSVTNGAENQVYEIMRISRDAANWSQSGYEITVRNTYYNGGGIVRAFVGYGYQDPGTLTILEAAGQNQPKIFLGSEAVVTGTIKYVPVNIQLPAYQYFSIEVKFGTTETTSISGASQVQFTGTTTTTGATGANHDGSVNLTGNVGIGNALIVAANAASAGTIRMPNNTYIYQRNAANNADVIAIGVNGSDQVNVGNGAPVLMPGVLNQTGGGNSYFTSNVGIGTTNPQALLHVGNGVASAFGSGAHPIGWPKALVYAPTGGVGSIVTGLLIDSDNGGTNFDRGVAIDLGLSNTGYGYYTSRIVHYGYAAATVGSRLQLQTHSTSLDSWNTGLFMNEFGNVGIGTTAPSEQLDIGGGTFRVQGQNSAPSSGAGVEISYASGTGYLQSYDRGSNANRALYISGSSIQLNGDEGNVGVGGPADANHKLNVTGNINSTQTVTANNIVAKYQDVAEWVLSSERLTVGTVVVLDSAKSNHVTSSSVSYDTRVAGVVSEQPGIALGEKSDGKVLVATTGRVRVKVDATKGPIHIGDLLVTSDVSGMAMKSKPMMIRGRQIHAPGTLIGKALEPLEKGKGSILVLLSLQ